MFTTYISHKTNKLFNIFVSLECISREKIFRNLYLDENNFQNRHAKTT